eukprot:Skav212862  [mRNA]  locus=scaffold151:4212:5104:+ [translate_table: standard]
MGRQIHGAAHVVFRHLQQRFRIHKAQMNPLVDSARSDQSWIQLLRMVGRHDDHSARRIHYSV